MFVDNKGESSIPESLLGRAKKGTAFECTPSTPYPIVFVLLSSEVRQRFVNTFRHIQQHFTEKRNSLLSNLHIIAQSSVLPALTVLLHCFLPHSLYADQDYRVLPITQEQGLPHSIVYSLLVDSRGFLWAGTRDGLARYDGYAFTIYWDGIEPLMVLTEDPSGNIWAGTSSGLYRFHRNFGVYTQFVNDPDDSTSLSNNSVVTLLNDSNGDLWVGTLNGLNRYDKSTNSFVRYTLPTELHESTEQPIRIFSVIEDPFNNVWVAVDDTERALLYVLHSNDTGFTRIRLPEKLYSRRYYPARLFFDQCGTLSFVISTPNETMQNRSTILLIRIDRHSGELIDTVQSVASNTLIERLFSKDIESNVGWVSKLGHIPERALPVTKSEGLYIADIECGESEVERDPFRMIYPPIFPSWTQGLHRDRGGLFWVSSDDGLYKFVPASYFFPPPIEIPTPDNGRHTVTRVRSIIRDSNKDLWVGTDGQLLQYNTSTNSVTEHTTTIGSPGSLQNRTVNMIYEDPPYLLIGTNQGLHQYNPKTSRFVLPYKELRNAKVRSIKRDKDGNLWVGTDRELIVYRPDNTMLAKVIIKFESPHLRGAVWKLFSDSKGRMWAGCQSGLYRWDSLSGRSHSYHHIPHDPHSLPYGSVWDIIEDSRGNIWIGVYGGGIARYRPETDDFTTISTESGLPSKGICAMLEDSRGNIWISTSKGLACYPPESNRIVTYTTADGLAGNEFALKASWKDQDGTLFFGGSNQITRFHPQLLQKNLHPPPIVVTSLRVNDSLVTLELLDNDTIRLEHWENHLEVEFAALDFLNPEGNLYQYKLQGVDNDWTYSGNRRYARYAGLDPGNYVLRIRGANSHGTWNNNGLRIYITIAHPFWETFWFRFSMIGIVLAGATLWLQSWRRRNREREERRVIEAKLQALRLQMKPHFMFNSLNSIHGFILQHKASQASEYLVKFARLMRTALYHSQHSLISLRDELAFLSPYLELEALRYNKAFTYSLDIEPNVQVDSTCIPSMLVQPYVENAIHHGLRNKSGGTLTIHFTIQANDILLCTIEDNGIGRKAAQQRQRNRSHQSIGTTVTQQRLELLNTIHDRKFRVTIVDLFDNSNLPKGTRVLLRIPYTTKTP